MRKVVDMDHHVWSVVELLKLPDVGWGGGHGTAIPFRVTDAGTYSPISALPTARGPRGTAASSPGTKHRHFSISWSVIGALSRHLTRRWHRLLLPASSPKATALMSTTVCRPGRRLCRCTSAVLDGEMIIASSSMSRRREQMADIASSVTTFLSRLEKLSQSLTKWLRLNVNFDKAIS